MDDVELRPARLADVPGITACVCEAYVHYIERIGRQPAPMLDDYARVLGTTETHVAVKGERVVGVLTLTNNDEGFCLDNIAVRPEVRGQGIGRRLLELAEREARRQGHRSIYLYTNEKMVENVRLYTGIGYVEYDRRTVDGYPRVFFRKPLA